MWKVHQPKRGAGTPYGSENLPVKCILEADERGRIVGALDNVLEDDALVWWEVGALDEALEVEGLGLLEIEELLELRR